MLARNTNLLRRLVFPFQGRRNQHTESVVTTTKIYELRTYAIWPQHIKDFLNLTSEEFHLRTAQSKLIGYWTSELGGLNEVVHIWEYDSLEHRAQVRANLAGNAEWIQRYFAKILPWMSGQQNSVISVIPGIPLSNSIEKGVYQLQTFATSPDFSPHAPSPIFKGNKSDHLIGAFKTLHGNLNSAILLWKHSSLTAATNFVSEQMRNDDWKHICSGHSKVLVPHKVSPLQ
ncbi:protein NipSnap homolog 3B [Daphnia magna]|uniref:protein NipSnap homolog 3B n=1 Tax=Daphnia magna TaxID=35525 RepID=UPI001E1BC34A|nr:protein NipSnap homolog 3B [Daphnia magna]